MRSAGVASVGLVAAVAFAAISAQAQAPFAPGDANLSARVAALEARLDVLEGDLMESDLLGTYRGTGLITDLDGGPPASVTMVAVSGTLTLAMNGQGTLDQSGGAIDLVQGNPWTDHAFTFPPQQIGITWSYANGILHVSDGTPNLDVDFNVGAGGRVLTLAELSDDNTADLFILTRRE